MKRSPKKTMRDLKAALRTLRQAELVTSRIARQLVHRGDLDLNQLSTLDREWVLDDLAWD